MKTFRRILWIGLGALCMSRLPLALPPGASASPLDLLTQDRPDTAPIPDRFTLINWNAQKGGDAQFIDDLEDIIERHDPDLMFLQEATEDLTRTRLMAPHFARGWRYPWPTGNVVGVMTASKAESKWVTPLKSRKREFGITVPKASLASRHALKDGQTLLAVNVHCLNFERWGTSGLADQLQDIRRIMQQHEGPILFAGDFNSWSERRYDLVLNIADELGLTEVDGFSVGRKTGDQGSSLLNRALGIDESLPLDRVFYRGLMPEACDVLVYDSSDHSALMVTFRLPDAEEPSSSALPD